MKLYTINATPVKDTDSLTANAKKVGAYPDFVAGILANFDINGFTIYKVQGYWLGTAEDSFKIEIATDNEANVHKICTLLRDEFNQDAVMLTNPDNSVRFI